MKFLEGRGILRMLFLSTDYGGKRKLRKAKS
jgi:hypothetical protein